MKITTALLTAVITASLSGCKTDLAEISAAAPKHDLQKGLVAYWPLDTLSATSPDLSGNRNHLQAFNLTAGDVVPGKRGKAISFNGTNSLLLCFATNGSGLPAYSHSACTVAMWVKGNVARETGRVFSETANTHSPLVAISTDRRAPNGVVDVYLRADDNNALVSHHRTSLVAFDDAWHHIALVDDLGHARLYVDGVLDTNGFAYTRGSITPTLTALGGVLRNDVVRFGFQGLIDEAAIWSRALTDVEVRYVMTNGLANLPPGTAAQPRTVGDAGDSGSVTANTGKDMVASVSSLNLSAQNEIPSDGIKLWFRADRGVTHSDNKVMQWDDQSRSHLHAKLNRGQPMLLPAALGGKPAIHFNGKGDVLEFKGWSPNDLAAMTIIIVSANTEYQPEPGPGKGAEGGSHSTLQSILNWPRSSPDAKWGIVLLSAYQKSVSFRFGTGQNPNINNWKRPASIGDSPTLTTAIHDGSTENLYVEGELVWTQTNKLTTIKNCATNGFIGRWSHGGDNSGWFAGNVAEIIVYTKALDDAERNKVEGYLKAKYFADKNIRH